MGKENGASFEYFNFSYWEKYFGEGSYEKSVIVPDYRMQRICEHGFDLEEEIESLERNVTIQSKILMEKYNQIKNLKEVIIKYVDADGSLSKDIMMEIVDKIENR